MTVAFDAASSIAVGTGDRNWSHNPVGTPRGVLVIVVHENAAGGEVAGVTYAGTSMSQTSDSPVLHTSPETGSIYAFFLGASVPTNDPATVAVDVTDTGDWIAACFTVTAAADVIVHDTVAYDNAGSTSTILSLVITASSFVAAGHYSGLSSPAGSPKTGSTSVQTGDFGQDTGYISRGDSIKTSNFDAGWDFGSSDEVAGLGVAITEGEGSNKVRTTSDSLSSLADSNSRLTTLARSISDSASSLSEATLRVKGMPRTVADTLASLSESIARVVAGIRSVADSFGNATASDNFSRTEGSSWGTADVGGTWSHDTYFGGGSWSVSGGLGKWTGGTTGDEGDALLTSTSVADFEGTFQASLIQEANYAGLIFREADSTFYCATIEPTPPDGGAIILRYYDAGWSTVTTGGAGSGTWDSWHLKVRASGTSIKVRAWPVGTSEPGTWNIDTTDSQSTAAGHVGAYLWNQGDTGELTIDNYLIQPLTGGGGITEGVGRITTAARSMADAMPSLSESLVRAVAALLRTTDDAVSSFAEAVVGIKNGGITAYYATADDALASLSEATARLTTLARGAADSGIATLSEAVQGSKVIVRTVGDELVFVYDYFFVQAGQWYATMADALSSVTEATSRAFTGSRSLADALASVSEAVSRIEGRVRTLSDSLPSLAEVVTGTKITLRTAADAIGSLSESVARSALSLSRAVQDALSVLSESVSRSGSFARAVADSVSALAEAVVGLKVQLRSVADTLSSVSESVVRVFTGSRTLVDSISAISETVGRLTSAARTLADTVPSLSEAVVGLKVQLRTIADALASVSESTARAFTGSRAVIDAISAIGEATARITSASRTLADALPSLSEAIVGLKVVLRTTAQSLGSISESLARMVGHPRTASQTIDSLAESVSRATMSVNRIAGDALASIIDSVSSVVVSIRSRASFMTQSSGRRIPPGPKMPDSQEPTLPEGDSMDQDTGTRLTGR